MASSLQTIESLSDSDLLSATRELVKRAGVVEADILEHLGEVEERKLFAACAHPSMIAFCVNELGFSEDAAFTRIFVARAARRLPSMVEALRSGRVHLTGLRLLVPHLTVENVTDVLERAAGKSTREIEELIARLAPRPDVRATIRKLPATQASFGLVGSKAKQHRPIMEPLSEGRYRMQFTGSRALKDKLRHAQGLLRHRIPDGDPGTIFEKALDLLICEVEKERFAIVANPKERKARDSGTGSRYIPAAIRRAVFARDLGRCTFVGAQGRRCRATSCLEFDHVEGFARNPVHSIEGIRLRCRAHNLYDAEKMYGRDFMDRARARAAPTCFETSPRDARSGEPISGRLMKNSS